MDPCAGRGVGIVHDNSEAFRSGGRLGPCEDRQIVRPVAGEFPRNEFFHFERLW